MMTTAFAVYILELLSRTHTAPFNARVLSVFSSAENAERYIAKVIQTDSNAYIQYRITGLPLDGLIMSTGPVFLSGAAVAAELPTSTNAESEIINA